MRPLAACVGACLLLAGLPGIATAAEAERVLLPRPERTPGDVLPECNSATLRQHGYSHSVRPPPGFTRQELPQTDGGAPGTPHGGPPVR